MCGILGQFTFQPASALKALVISALSMLHHRGPDDRGYDLHQVADGILALGHTRLSIIDLSTGGHQPMHTPDGRWIIVFNGEIYNYRELRKELQLLGRNFSTDSDTEVLLSCWVEWRQDCLPRLRGMFAFVVYDTQTHILTCVRDAFGIKPLFFHTDQRHFSFASELPALLALLPDKPELNAQQVYDYLVMGYYDHDVETFHQGVYQLAAGHILTLDLVADPLEPKIVRWWWPSIIERTDLSFADATDQLRTMFLDSVRLHLRSDVALGAALSGGIDSSAVVCAMRHLEPDMPIHTFSYVARGSNVDEEMWVDQVNHHVGAIAHKVIVSPHELADDLVDMVRSQGEPFGSTSIYAQYRVFKLVRENGITVTLDGQGADELLAGYHGYPGQRLRSLLERGQFIELLRLLERWGQWPGRSRNEALRSLLAPYIPYKLRGLALKLIGRDPVPSWLNVDAFRQHGTFFGRRLSMDTFTQSNSDARGRRLVQMLRSQLTEYGLNALLRHGDRNSMRWSVESRVPFLTTDMAEFLLSLPEHYLLSREGETKHIFRAAMRGIVPDTILDRRDKIGFQTPELDWFKELGDQVFKWLDVVDELPMLNAIQCRQEIKQILDGKKRFTWQIWRLINFCRWYYFFRM